MLDQARSDRIATLADECVKCGLCLPHCPTYALDATETESPRGRIALATGATSGVLSASFDLRLHLDHCLGCMACERVCPVPVQYGALLVETRAALPPARRRPRFVLKMLSRPRVLRFCAALARWTAAKHWVPFLTRLLLRKNSSLRTAPVLLPVLPRVIRWSHPQSASVDSLARANQKHVALFGGCVQGVFERDAQNAARRLLNAAGYEVFFVDGICCGALAAHTGDATRAQHLATAVRETFATSGTEVLLTATPGCLGTLRAALPDTRVKDAQGFLAANSQDLRFKSLNARIALHLPCTQVNVARAGDAVRGLLARIPGLKIDILPTQAQCCGAAGAHMLEFPQRAAAYREKVLATLPLPSPDLLLTSNIGCRLHLAAGLSERGSNLRIEHPLVLLARQLQDSANE